MEATNWKTILEDWLKGVIMASRRMIGGKQVKTMTRGMSLVFVNSMANRVEQVEWTPTGTVIEPIEKFKKVEVMLGHCAESDVEINELNSNQVELTYHNCIYGNFCNEVLSKLLSTGEFTEKTIPCLRLSNASAAVTHLSKIRSPYKLIQFAPGAICKGVVGNE